MLRSPVINPTTRRSHCLLSRSAKGDDFLVFYRRKVFPKYSILQYRDSNKCIVICRDESVALAVHVFASQFKTSSIFIRIISDFNEVNFFLLLLYTLERNNCFSIYSTIKVNSQPHASKYFIFYIMAKLGQAKRKAILFCSDVNE